LSDKATLEKWLKSSPALKNLSQVALAAVHSAHESEHIEIVDQHMHGQHQGEDNQ